MKHEELQILLVEYVEGSINPEHKILVEEALRSSAQLREELQEIRLTFTMLQSQSIPEIPSHYFGNFIPRLRERIDREERKYSFIVPEWLLQLFKPAASFGIAILLFSFYHIFQSGIQQHQILEIVRNAQTEDLSELTNYAKLETDGTEQLVEHLSEFVSYNSLEQQFQNTFVKNSAHSETETNELVYATIEPIVNDLNDEEINLVIEKINSSTKN